jgi:hypothetical protein
MNEVTVDPIGMASPGISDSVRDHLRPIIAKSSKPVLEFRSGLMSSTGALVGLFEHLPCLFL